MDHRSRQLAGHTAAGSDVVAATDATEVKLAADAEALFDTELARYAVVPVAPTPAPTRAPAPATQAGNTSMSRFDFNAGVPATSRSASPGATAIGTLGVAQQPQQHEHPQELGAAEDEDERKSRGGSARRRPRQKERLLGKNQAQHARDRNAEPFPRTSIFPGSAAALACDCARTRRATIVLLLRLPRLGLVLELGRRFLFSQLLDPWGQAWRLVCRDWP